MRKCAIIIETSQGKLIAPVVNFTKENCVNALAKVIKVDADKIEQVSASVNHGIYALKENFPSAKEMETYSTKFHSNEYSSFFVVEYGYFA